MALISSIISALERNWTKLSLNYIFLFFSVDWDWTQNIPFMDDILENVFKLFEMLIRAFWMNSVLGVLSGSGSCAPPAVGRVSAQWNSDPCVSGLPLLSRNRPLHQADLRTSAAAPRSHCHRPAVPAARFLVRSSVWMTSINNTVLGVSKERKLMFRCLLIAMETKEEENEVNVMKELIDEENLFYLLLSRRNTEERRLLWKLSNLSPTNHSKGQCCHHLFILTFLF